MDVTLSLIRKNNKRAVKFQKLSFILAGFILLLNLTEYSPGRNEPQYFKIIYIIAYLIGGSLNLAAAFFYDKIKPVEIKEHVVRWFNSVTGVLLIFDAAQKFSNDKTGLTITIFLTGMLYIFISFYWETLKKRRNITVNDDKITFRKSIFRTKSILLTEIDELQLTREKINITLKNGKSLEFFLGDNDELAIVQFDKKVKKLK